MNQITDPTPIVDRRILIAQDVIAQIRAKRIMAKTGNYIFAAGTIDAEDRLLKIMENLIANHGVFTP